MTSRLSPVSLVLVGIASVQFGAGVAKSLFDEAGPTTVVWLRLVASAVVLMALARPHLRRRTREDWLVVLAFGAALALMNAAYYQSLDRIPMGLAVTIEFVAGPLLLAVFAARRLRDFLWVLLAGVGVALLGLSPGALTWPGVLFAMLAGLAWAAYILLSARTGARWPGVDGLAVASVVAAVLLTPLAVGGALGDGGRVLPDLQVVLLGATVGMLSSVIPYSCELIALRSLPASVFGILMSLEPAAAALAGIIVLGEVLMPVQWLAMACVVAASIGATRARPVLSEPVPD